MIVRLNRNRIRVVVVLLVVVLAVSVGLHLLQVWEDRRTPSAGTEVSGRTADEEQQAMVFLNDRWYTARDGIETVLLLGLDKDEETLPEEQDSYVNEQQADFILLLLLDHANRRYTAVHINRDSMAEIPELGVAGDPIGTVTGQLALAHTYGSGKNDSCKNTVSAVSGFLYGVEIDHYLSLTMDAVARVNDLVGGVPVTLLDDFTAVDPTMVKDQEITLSGSQALSYVRARGELEDSSNIRRMERQRQYLHALHQQAEKQMTSDQGFLLDSLLQVSPYLVSDCTVNRLTQIGECVLQYTDEGIRTIEGESVRGAEFMEFYPDEDRLKDLVVDLFYVEAEDEP